MRGRKRKAFRESSSCVSLPRCIQMQTELTFLWDSWPQKPVSPCESPGCVHVSVRASLRVVGHSGTTQPASVILSSFFPFFLFFATLSAEIEMIHRFE